MKTGDTSVADRRSQTRDLIDKLLAERKELLALLFDSSSPEPDPKSMERERLKEFCEILVDYIAAGHFGLYQRIAEGAERRTAVLAVAEQVYPRIESITHAAVAFNDECETNDYEPNGEIINKLSELVENLSTRFELEDRVIEGMLKS